MPFIETEAKKEIKEINGKPTVVITPECEITLKNLKTGQEYVRCRSRRGCKQP
jgi:hypothetical protein